MNSRIKTKRLVTAGLLLALGVVIPSIFHTTGIPGTIFLPMHIPVLIGGFLLPPSLALLLGALTPLLNSLITTMPPLFPMAIIMVFELAVYGFITSILSRKLKLPSVISLIFAMIGGRIVAGFVVFMLVSLFTVQMDPIMFVKTGIITGLPGIGIQIVLIPILVYAINKYTTINID